VLGLEPFLSVNTPRVKLVRRGELIYLAVDAVVACVGKTPCLPLLPPQVARDNTGEPIVDSLGERLYLVFISSEMFAAVFTGRSLSL